jgi:glycosyltransferase involved in cell wall biosynthesis
VRASVVLACRNGEAFLAETLEAVLTQEWDRPWEVVFVDNGSTDRSLSIFRGFAARYPRVALRSVDAGDRPGKSHALNRGIAAAAGRSIVLVDCDDVPAPGWLAAMGAALELHDFVSACNESARLNTGPTGIYRDVPASTWELPYAPFARCTAGATMGFTRELYDAVGGFATRFQPEDDEFCVRAHLAGFGLHVVPDAVVHYRLRRDLAAIFSQAFHYSRTDVQIAKAYRACGPAQRGRWRGLAREAAALAKAYLGLRLHREGMAAEARFRWRLGGFAGQLAGVVKYRAAPTTGRIPGPRRCRREAGAPVGA